MLRAAVVVLGGFVVGALGCSSPLKENGSNTDAGSTGSCPINGNYSVMHKYEETNCSEATGLSTTTPDIYTFTIGPSNVVTLSVESLGGSCSGGPASGCELPLTCSATLAGGGTATFTATYIFTSTGFSGQLELSETPEGATSACTYVYLDTGTLQQ